MHTAVDAICRDGHIVPLELVQFAQDERVLSVLHTSTDAVAPRTGAGPGLDWQQLAGMLKASPNWNGDPQAQQQAVRDEWA